MRLPFVFIAHPVRTSRDIARHNARQASRVLDQRRMEREEVERHLAALPDQGQVRIPEQRSRGAL